MKALASKVQPYNKYFFILAAIGLTFTSPALGLLGGIVYAMTLENPFPFQSKKISKKLLQYSVVGLGFGMNLEESLQSGKEGMLMTIVSVASIMVIGWFIGKLLKLPKGTSYMISAGTAICGGSAIAAVSPLTKSSESEISVSLATIFILNAIALFIFPPIGRWLGMTDIQFGTWAAMAIHDTSSVVGAGAAFSEKALQVATTVKLTRALWIIPLAIVTTFIFKDKNSKISIPWFILFFVLAMVAGTYLPIPKVVITSIVWLARKALVLTLFLIGAGLSLETIRTVGFRPMILGLILWVFIGCTSLAVIMNM